LAGALGEISLGHRLHAPGQALDQPDAVVGGLAFFAEQTRETPAQFGQTQAAQGSNFLIHVHQCPPGGRVSNPLTGKDSEHGFCAKLKAIER
jgi:hypothetical protein